MPTHAELAGRLLNDVAGFFRTLALQNEAMRGEMNENANVYEHLAGLLIENPNGAAGDQPYSQMAAGLLQDAADFFRTLGQENEPLQEQMAENARIYEYIAQMVTQNPLGILD